MRELRIVTRNPQMTAQAFHPAGFLKRRSIDSISQQKRRLGAVNKQHSLAAKSVAVFSHEEHQVFADFLLKEGRSCTATELCEMWSHRFIPRGFPEASVGKIRFWRRKLSTNLSYAATRKRESFKKSLREGLRRSADDALMASLKAAQDKLREAAKKYEVSSDIPLHECRACLEKFPLNGDFFPTVRLPNSEELIIKVRCRACYLGRKSKILSANKRGLTFVAERLRRERLNELVESLDEVAIEKAKAFREQGQQAAEQALQRGESVTNCGSCSGKFPRTKEFFFCGLHAIPRCHACANEIRRKAGRSIFARL